MGLFDFFKKKKAEPPKNKNSSDAKAVDESLTDKSNVPLETTKNNEVPSSINTNDANIIPASDISEPKADDLTYDETVMLKYLDGKCYIGIDKNATDKEELVYTAHELGHCETGSFYNRYSKFNVISKYEYKADKWAIQQLIPIDELMTAVNEGYTDSWQLADYFGVTEDFVHRAYEIYKTMGMFN